VDGSRDQLRRLAVLIAASGIDMIGFAMVFPLLPLYARDLQATPEEIGVLLAAYSVAQLLMAPLWGRVSDRYGRRPALLIGLFAAGVAYVVFAFANSFWLLLLSRLVQGAGGGTTAVAQAYVADTIQPSDRARALGWLSAASSLGIAIGPVFGSAASHWGQAGPGLIAATLCFLNVGFAWRMLPESRAPVDHGRVVAQRRPVWHAAWAVVQHPERPVSRLVLIYGAGMLGFTAMTAVQSLYLVDHFAMTAETIGYVFMYMGVLSLVMRSLLLGPMIKRFGEAGAMRLGTASLTLGLLLYPLADSLVTLAVILPLMPVGTALLFPATTSLMSRASAREELGLTMGVAQTFAGLARVAAPLLSNSAYQRFGIGSPFLLAGATVALVGVLAVRATGTRGAPVENP
jgi:MFS family permease